jgi:hypothetical protein
MFSGQKSGERQFVAHILPCFVCDIRHNLSVTSNLVLNRPVRQIWSKRLRVPLARCPPHKAPGLFFPLVRHLFPNLAVLAAEKQQRFALTHYFVLYFGNEDGVVASLLRRLQPAFQVR